jgi:dihydrofolate reductase
MRRLFLHISVSVDGYIADDAGAIDWVSADDEFQRHIDRMLESIGGMIFGRVAFEQLAAFWPDAGPEMSPIQVQRMHELPKYVLSSSLRHTDWHNSHPLGDDPAAAIIRLKRQEGRDLALFAGASATGSLLALGVIDELRLLVHPVAARTGRRLFDEGDAPYHLTVTATQAYPTGVIRVIYAPSEAPATAE